MAVRSDIQVFWTTSPRILMVRAPSVEVTIQDLVDTCRFHEMDPVWFNEDHLISASGKEDLGGGVLVGITAKLNNAQVAFECRPTPAATGMADQDDATGVVLHDALVDFVALGVTPGATAFNITDGSVATVRKVEEHQLTCLPLQNGADNEWAIGDSYEVVNTVQCSISGGNLVAVDELGVEMSSVMPTAFTQVVRTASSSATLQELDAIQYSSFEGAVTIDVVNGVSGTLFPIGTKEVPVDNLADALLIDAERGFHTFRIVGALVVGAGYDIADRTFVGNHQAHDSVVINPAAVANGCLFRNLYVEGTLDGGSALENCRIGDLNYIDGVVVDCMLGGTVTLAGTGLQLVNCYCATMDGSPAVVDMGGAGHTAAIYNYTGCLKLQNMTGAADYVAATFLNGDLTIDPTVSAGTVVVMGNVEVTNGATGTAAVNTEFAFAPGADRKYLKVIQGLSAKAAVG